ncbi:tetraspanin Tsp2 family [Mycena vulgaris]|nr:tetraspanin Tsp2 family [Mycena vulgaris]
MSEFGINPEHRASTSLSVNYLPSKFSDALAVGSARRRRPPKQGSAPAMARGGGVDAFRKGEARMPEDRDDLHPSAARKGWFDRSETGSRWTRFKWVLFFFNLVYTVIALVALVGMILIWLDIPVHADVIRVANRTELIFSTLAAAVAVFTSVFGWAGVMLNNRSFLAVYASLLWLSFAFLVVPGYITYRRQDLNLAGKLNFQWSEAFGVDARRRVQNALGCCGYPNPFVEASISARCYARSVLPGCKGPYLSFERAVLRRWFTAVFSLAAFHIAVIAAALLCANHVTYRFGKGMMPKAYRLNAQSVALIMDNYAQQLAEQYGPDVAAAAIAHSRAASTVDLGDLAPMPFSSAPARPASPDRQRYGAITPVPADTTL